MEETKRRIRRSPEQAEREILDAAEAILAERAFRELSVDELMARTGMTRSTFYHYFRSLDEIAIALLHRVHGEMMEAIGFWLEAADDEDPLPPMRRAIGAVAGVYARHGPVMAAINAASFHYESVESVWRERLLEDWLRAIVPRVRAARERGLSAVEDPEATVRALLLMNTVVFADRLGTVPGDPPEAVAGTLAGIWAAALYR